MCERSKTCAKRLVLTVFCAKCPVTVLMGPTYTQVALDHLSDTNTYQKVPCISAKTVKNIVNTAWKKICLQNKIASFLQKSLFASNTDLPRFYHLVKTHKAGPDIKIQPIISNINGPTQHISWLLAKALKPMLKMSQPT